MGKVLALTLVSIGMILGISEAPAGAATVVFTGTRANVNALAPPGGRCVPTYFNTVNIAPGALSSTGSSNFGNFSSTQSHCIVSAPPTSVVEGLFSYAFSAGDLLTGTYSGSVGISGTPGVFDAIENLVVTGGTGRFLGATGTITSVGTLRFGPNPSGTGTVGIFDGNLSGILNAPAVPEPSTWAMMIGGFGMVGFAMRSARRKQKVSVSYA